MVPRGHANNPDKLRAFIRSGGRHLPDDKAEHLRFRTDNVFRMVLEQNVHIAGGVLKKSQGGLPDLAESPERSQRAALCAN